jgi:hypothetical protein
MDPAYEIRGQRYPVVDKFRHGDPALVCEITGLDWDRFIDLLVAADDEASLDIRVQTAMVAVAVAHVHRGWSRDKVVKFVSQLELEEVQLEGVEEAAEDPTQDSAPNGSETGSSTPPTPANGSPAAPSSPTPTGSGSHGSVTTSPALHPLA